MDDVGFPGVDSELLTMTRCEGDRDHAGVVVVAAVGEVDETSARVFWDSLAGELGPGRRVVLDLSAVTFLATVGVRLLLRAHTGAQSRGTVFAVADSDDGERHHFRHHRQRSTSTRRRLPRPTPHSCRYRPGEPLCTRSAAVRRPRLGACDLRGCHAG